MKKERLRRCVASVCVLLWVDVLFPMHFVRAANSYILPDSNNRYLSASDIADMTAQVACYARNEIFARHGRQFLSNELTEYFSGQIWYNGTISPSEFPAGILSNTELFNVQMLLEKEYELCQGGYVLDQAEYDFAPVYAYMDKNISGGEGASVSDDILQAMLAGEIRELGQAFYLDLDRDGEEEWIEIQNTDEQKSYYENHCNHYSLCAGEYCLDAQGENVQCTVYGVSLDGKNILLIIYEEGPSNDPVCTFYCYENDSLKNIGYICDAVNRIQINPDGTISGRERCNVIETGAIYLTWMQDMDGMIVKVKQEYYQMFHYEGDFSVKLNRPIMVYQEMNEESAAVVMEVQAVTFLYTDGEEWVYVQGEKGTGGWLRAGILTMEERVNIFSGLVFAD